MGKAHQSGLLGHLPDVLILVMFRMTLPTRMASSQLSSQPLEGKGARLRVGGPRVNGRTSTPSPPYWQAGVGTSLHVPGGKKGWCSRRAPALRVR